MPTAKKTPQKKKTAASSRAANSTAKRKSQKPKFVLPPIQTTALEKSLEPGDEKDKKSKRDKNAAPKHPLALPGYLAFTAEVWLVLWKFKSTFWRLVAVYAILIALFGGFASQSVYGQLSSLLRETGGEVFSGDISKVSEAGELLLISLIGAANPEATGEQQLQQLIGGLLMLVIWLTTVWLLRAFLAGHSPRLRDGFYNSGSPLVPTLLLSFVFVGQLIPAAIAAIAISAAIPTGLISGGIVMVLFWIVAMLFIVLSLYWITSTFIALIVVTLPGMYPMKALQTARELVKGRRLRIVLRMVWLLFISAVFWVLFMIPIILFDAALKGVWQAIDWLPIVPTAFLFASSIVVIWMASYAYLFYRKVVDYDSASA